MQNHPGNYEPILTIGAIASQLRVAVQTIRMYEKQGLILPLRTQTGRRMYSLNDLEKLRCIRRLITEEGLNINGIKKLMAMIPCWDFKGGLDSDCLNCHAYIKVIGPCWSVREVGAKCNNMECRTCEVYQMNISCNNLKDLLVRRNEKKLIT
jgi:MerR family transcriptional regulator/heat shock protein HspR